MALFSQHPPTQQKGRNNIQSRVKKLKLFEMRRIFILTRKELEGLNLYVKYMYIPLFYYIYSVEGILVDSMIYIMINSRNNYLSVIVHFI